MQKSTKEIAEQKKEQHKNRNLNLIISIIAFNVIKLNNPI